MRNKDRNDAFGAYADVKPLSTTERSRPRKNNTGPTLSQKLSRANAEDQVRRKDPNYLTSAGVVSLEPDQELAWKLSGVQPDVFRLLQSGSYEIKSSLDLHKRTIEEARILVWDFIEDCLRRDYRCVRIVHGTGRLSDPPALMKSHAAHWLQEHDAVIAFATAPARMGGTGASLVKLRKSYRAKETNRENFGLKSG